MAVFPQSPIPASSVAKMASAATTMTPIAAKRRPSAVLPTSARTELAMPATPKMETAMKVQWHFMKQVPNDYLFPGSNTSEPVILQGIIDAFFIEDGEIVLVDYKSDHVREAETLIGRYQKQLELYAEALEKITGLRVKEKLIYSIILEQAIPV